MSINQISLVISIIGLAVFFFMAIARVLEDGFKGLKSDNKRLLVSFIVYLIFFNVFIFTK